MNRRNLIVLGVTVLVIVALCLLAVFDILTPGEVLSTIILAVLVTVAVYYAMETRVMAKATQKQVRVTQEQTRESKRARYGGLHPILSIVSEMEVKTTSSPQQNWLHRDNPIKCNDIRVVNIGPGPALRGKLSVYVGTNVAQVSSLPPLASGWGHTANINTVKNYNEINLLKLSYDDVFGYKHETSFNIKFTDSLTLRVEDESHECFYIV